MTSADDDSDEYEDAATTRVRALNRWVLVISILFASLGAMLTAPMMVLGWVVGLLPLAVLCLVAWWAARNADEPLRFPVTCTMLVAVLIWWMFFTVAIVVLATALLACALPARPWRLHVLGPLLVSATLLAIVHPFDSWALPPKHMIFPVLWLLPLHLIVLMIVVVKFCRLPTPR